MMMCLFLIKNACNNFEIYQAYVVYVMDINYV